jgi:hypothetical protein
MSDVPSREEWQKTIDGLGYNLQLWPTLEPFKSSGFVPCKLNGIDGGFEISYEEISSYNKLFPHLKEKLKDYDYCITFTWGSSMIEGACVLIASLALLKACNAFIYYPNDNLISTEDSLVADIKSCLK